MTDNKINFGSFLPGHFYSPIPDVPSLPDSIWDPPAEMAGVDLNDAVQLDLLTKFREFESEYNVLPTQATSRAYDYHFNNPAFDGTDGLVLYSMLRHFRPDRVVEVGAGYSTRLAALAATRNQNTELVTIEPYPDAVISAGFPGLKRLIASPVQQVGLDYFQQLKAGDVLFIDSSHVVKIGSDVLYLYLEVIPRLASGVIIHVHDVFLPYEYPSDWIKDLGLFWTEQYLLRAFLMFNRQFEVLMANNYLAHKYPEEFKKAFPRSNWWGGGSFWMRRVVGS